MVAPFIEYELQGPLPVFPLPDFVLFPSVKTSLFIFEPRYRRLVEDCLDREGTFCMATYECHPAANMGREPDFYRVGCLVKLVDYQKHADGCYTIIVQGVARVHMQEVEGSHGYRRVMARGVNMSGREQVCAERESELRGLTAPLCSESSSPELFKRTLDSLELEDLLNVMSFHGLASLTTRQHLLESTSLPGLCDELIDLYKVHH